MQSTVKPSVATKYSHMDYQKFSPMTKPPQKQRIFTGSNFAEHDYNYVNRSQTSKPPRTNLHNRSFSQRQNPQQKTSNFVNFNDNPRIPTDPSENYPYFNRIKIVNSHTNINEKHFTIHLIIIHQMMTIFMTKTINKIFKTKDSTLITQINQIFLNHIHENNICDNLD